MKLIIDIWFCYPEDFVLVYTFRKNKDKISQYEITK